MSERWIRLNTTWGQSEWLADLSPESRLVWVEVLCHVKAHGHDGAVKAPGHAAFARVTGVTRDAVDTLVRAATEHGALAIEEGEWVVTGWRRYQGDPTGKQRQRRYRQRQKEVTESEDVAPVTGVTRHTRSVTPTETETETIKPPIVPQGGSAKRRKSKLPDDWQPNDRHRETASAAGFDVDGLARDFRDHAEATGRVQLDWDAAFRTWINRAPEMSKHRRARSQSEHPYRKAHEVMW